MDVKPILVVDGAKIEIDGDEVVLLQVPFRNCSQEVVDQLGPLLEKWSRKVPLYLVQLRPDGGCSVVVPGPLKGVLEAKKPSEFHWTKIQIYQPCTQLW